MCKILWYVHVGLVYLLAPLLVRGQDVAYIKIRKYNQSNGLSSYNVNKILQDRRGFLWVATQDGINLFDGNQFVKFQKSSSGRNAIDGNNVSDLVEDTVRGLIWTANSYGGINSVDVQSHMVRHRVLLGPNNIPFSKVWIRSIAIYNDNLWIGSSTGLYVYNIPQRSFLKVAVHAAPHLKIDSLDVPNLLVVGDLVYAFCNNYGVVVANGASCAVTQILNRDQLDISPSVPFKFEDASRSGHSIWMATSEGLRWLDLYSFKIKSIRSSALNAFYKKSIFSCRIDVDNCLWFSDTKGLYKYNPALDRLLRIVDDDFGNENWYSSIYQVFNDVNNDIWIASQQGLAFINDGAGAFISYSRSKSSLVKIQHAYSLLPLNDSVILCGAEMGLFKVFSRSHEVLQIGAGSAYSMLCRLPDDNVLISNEDGLQVYHRNELVAAGTLYPELKTFNKELFNSGCRYDDSLFIFGSENDGFFIWDWKNKQVFRYSRKTGFLLDNDIVNGIYVDKETMCWILSENTLLSYSPIHKTQKKYSLFSDKDSKPISLLFDMCETSDSYWIAAYGTGIIETTKSDIKIKRIFSSADGLSDNCVYKVFSYTDSLIIATTNNGLSVINTVSGRIKRFYQIDGLHDNAFEEACGTMLNGVIYAGGMNGFTVADPKFFNLQSNPPAIYYTNIRIDTRHGAIDTSNLDLERLEVRDDWLQVNVSFSGINYRESDKVEYQYTIKEIDSAWVNLGNQKFITLIGLNPGIYHIQVKASLDRRAWSEPIALMLIFLPKWYQTWWFRSIVALLLMATLYSLYRYRLWQINKEQEIRQRIASDLHDDIGSTLNSVKVFTNLAIMKPENNISYLEQLKEGVQGAIVGVRDMVWVLDDKQDTIDHLVSRIELFINPLAAAQNIVFEKSVDTTLADRMLRKEEKRNFYLIIKEALNNSIKYSSASTLQLRIYKSPHDKCCIAIQDNGVGFDLVSVQRGNGLNNLQSRAQQIRYNIEINTAPGKGTLIVLSKS